MAKQANKMIQSIIKRYGPVIDLKANPHLMVEILRHYGGLVASEPGTGNPPKPPAPPPEPPPGEPGGPSPGPTSYGGIEKAELMKALQQIKMEVRSIKQFIGNIHKTR